MPRVILTTCGISLLTSNCWQGISNTESILRLNSPQKEEHEKRYRSYIQQYRSIPNDLAEKFVINVWNDVSQITKLPAELASLKTIKIFCERNSPPGPLNQNDRLILLHADNDEAIFCAKVIHSVLVTQGLLNQVSIESLWSINNLDPRNPQEFLEALITLWQSLRERIPFPREGERYYLNLTGGYKAIIILLSCFAYYKGIADTHVFYLNEESGEEVLVMGFDPAASNFEERLKIGYIEARTGLLKSPDLPPQDF